MSGVVRKSSPVIVRPSRPKLQTSKITLSYFDKGLVDLPATFFFVFERPIHKPAEIIKSALSQALVHYYPIAGRLAQDADDGKLCIQCTGEGVVFMAAAASCTLKEMGFLDRSLGTTTLLNELAIGYPAKRCSHTDPLLLMQVTEFSCGGYVIGLTRNHVISDASGMAQFLQAVGELARGLPAPTVVPVRYDDSLPAIPPVAPAQQNSTMNHEAQDFIFLDITIPSSLINHIKSKFSKDSNSKPCTVFEVVAAVLWQCRTRATMSDPEAPTMLFFTASARKLVGAKHGYYGNCVSNQSVMATSRSVANGETVDIVKMIKRAKEQIVPYKSMKDKGGQGNNDMHRYRYNHLGLSCMRNLGLDELDFGGGRPARVMCHVPQMPVPICAACLPWKGKDGANVLSRCVKEQHAAAFLAELEKFTP